MSKQEYQALRKSVERFGFKSFVVVEEVEPGRFGVIDGHHRWKLAAETHMDRIPVVLLDQPNATDADLAMLTFNITGSPQDEAFFDLLTDLATRYDIDELAASTALSEAFLTDMTTHVDAVLEHALNPQVDGGKEKGSDSSLSQWHGTVIRVDVPSTDEARALLAQAREATGQPTDGQAVLEVLRRYFGAERTEHEEISDAIGG